MANKKYCVYLIHFYDRSVYIGCTYNFKRRIQQHIQNCKIKYKNRPLYLKMNENRWNAYILINNIEERNVAFGLEELLTIKYREEKYQVLNIKNGNKLDDETKSILRIKNSGKNSYWYNKDDIELTREKLSKSISKIVRGSGNPMYGKHHTEESKQKMRKSHPTVKGKNNPKAKPREYFESHATVRSHFKTTCKKMEWLFDDFKEVFAEWYVKPNGNRERKYYYIYKNITGGI